MKKLFFLIVFVISFLHLNAQNKDVYKDVVYLKNNSKIYGQILDYKIGEKVTVKLKTGQVLTFNDNIVERIVMYSPDEEDNEFEKPEKKKPEYKFKDNYFYNTFGLKLISGSRSVIRNDAIRYGVGLDYSMGYRRNNFLSIGIGASLENYGYGLNELIIPVFFEYMCFLKKTPVSPFVKTRIGYGFNQTFNNRVIEKDGGIAFSAAFGLKYPAYDNLSYMLDLNFKYQKAYFVYSGSRWSQRISYRDVIFRRFSIRFTVMF